MSSAAVLKVRAKRSSQRPIPAVLCTLMHAGDALWVVSPLRRAIETFLLACPLAAEVAPGGRAGRSSGILRISGTSHQLPMHGNIEVRVCVRSFSSSGDGRLLEAGMAMHVDCWNRAVRPGSVLSVHTMVCMSCFDWIDFGFINTYLGTVYACVFYTGLVTPKLGTPSEPLPPKV